MRSLLCCLAVLLYARSAAAASQGYKASASNPAELIKILDLVFRVESVAGAIQDMQVKETETEIRLELAADVLFDFDKADLRAAAEETLTRAAKYLTDYPKGVVRIEGHTDGKGTPAYNERLSLRRAESVRKWFADHGAAARAFSLKGWGAQQPIAPNTKPDGSDDPDGRQKNRRVEIIITKS